MKALTAADFEQAAKLYGVSVVHVKDLRRQIIAGQLLDIMLRRLSGSAHTKQQRLREAECLVLLADAEGH